VRHNQRFAFGAKRSRNLALNVDARFGLTDDEFRLERDLIVIGPLFGDTGTQVLATLEQAGLEYFDDYVELSGNWPEWLRIYAMGAR
jgi:hypothetical protein